MVLVSVKFKQSEFAYCIPIWRVEGAGSKFRSDNEDAVMSNAGRFISQFLSWRVSSYDARLKEIRSAPYLKRKV